jgi:2-polyprenyl-6-methoxyphenol hydroxylase-like FAD-dependent oxidoreductase
LHRAERKSRLGEVLNSSALPLLREIDPGEALAKGMIRPVPSTKSRWGGPVAEERAAIFNPYGSDVLLDRQAFDAGLLALAAAEPTITAIPLSGPPHAEERTCGWRVACGGHRSWEGAYVIDGSGRTAFMARRFGRRLVLDRLICSGWELEGEDGLDRDERLIVAGDRVSWWYSIRTGPRTRVLGRVSAAGNSGHPDIETVPRPAPEEISETIETGRYRVRRRFGLNASIEVSLDKLSHRWLAAGDAYATLDPLSGQGCLRAIADARAVAMAVKELISGSRDAAEMLVEERRRMFLAEVARRRSIYARETRFVGERFWADRI